MTTFDQLLFDLTDIAIIIVVIAVWSLVVVGAYTVLRWVVLFIWTGIDSAVAYRIERRAIKRGRP